MKQLIEYSLEKRLFFEQTRSNKFNIILFQGLKKHSLNSTNNCKRLLDIFLKQTINIRALFHHFRIIWNYSNKRKTATLAAAIPHNSLLLSFFSPPQSLTAFFTATREGGGKLSSPPPLPPILILVPFFFLRPPSRLFARHFLSLPAGKFSFTGARIRESSTRPREARSKK